MRGRSSSSQPPEAKYEGPRKYADACDVRLRRKDISTLRTIVATRAGYHVSIAAVKAVVKEWWRRLGTK
jgi:hypothetical protein